MRRGPWALPPAPARARRSGRAVLATPNTFEDAAAALAAAAADGRSVRISGGETKLAWSPPGAEPDVVLRMTALDQVLEHNAGDLTAVIQAGARFAAVQEQLAAAGQMLALDPPLGPDEKATIGGVFATADCGPLRHRYGLPRDLILGITVALGDGTIARAGGKVIKNVAGYDLSKLFTGSFGTLGAILAVSVRVHPIAEATRTAVGTATDSTLLARAAVALSAAPLELSALDFAWRAGRGGLLAQCAGSEAMRRARRVAKLMQQAGLDDVEVTDEDGPLWARQRAGQRSERAAIVRVSARPSDLPAVLRAGEGCGGTVVGRAALGSSFIEVEPGQVGALRDSLPAGTFSVVLDGPADLADRWGAADSAALELMRRVKARFDPAYVCNPGVFVGGI